MEEEWDNECDWGDEILEEEEDILKPEPITFDNIEKKYKFGENAYLPIPKPDVKKITIIKDTDFIKSLFTSEIDGFLELRGQRGQKTILNMI